MAYKEEAVVSVKDVIINEEVVEERVKVVTYFRRKGCKCKASPYTNSCIFCQELILPLVCPICGYYYCRCSYEKVIDITEGMRNPY